MKLDMDPSWHTLLQEEFNKPYFSALKTFVEHERAEGHPVYPAEENVFLALKLTPYDKVKVVVVGQDPYHGPHQAHGLAFSVPHGVVIPPSLKNIFKELKSDLGIEVARHGCLEKWAKEGVLLLNTFLTVRDGEPLSHSRHGWEQFTDAIIKALAKREDPVIFLLWGENAKKKCAHVAIDSKGRDYILEAAHPSPLSASRGFLGCRHFSKVNTILESLGKPPIDWAL